MNNEEIKAHVQNCYATIKGAEDFLKELRSICKHENTFEGNYEYRPGATIPAIICSDCGKMIRNVTVYAEQ